MSLSTDIAKAKRRLKASEMRENFGQNEVRKIKDKHGYHPYGTQAERAEAQRIDRFNEWCMNYVPIT